MSLSLNSEKELVLKSLEIICTLKVTFFGEEYFCISQDGAKL